MVALFTGKHKKREKQVAPSMRTTTVSFSAEDLAELGHIVAVGQTVLQKRPAVVFRLKAAMTRLGVRLPHGL